MKSKEKQENLTKKKKDIILNLKVGFKLYLIKISQPHINYNL